MSLLSKYYVALHIFNSSKLFEMPSICIAKNVTQIDILIEWHFLKVFPPFFSLPGLAAVTVLNPLTLAEVRQVFYHCVTIAGQYFYKSDDLTCLAFCIEM